MPFQIRPLQQTDIFQAAALDKRWFGEYGIEPDELAALIEKNPESSLALLENDAVLGFATFEVLNGTMPRDYVGSVTNTNKVLFIQQFTTTTNYNAEGMTADEHLLSAVEQKAQELGCHEVWEALSIDHPYRKENNSEFDAFGFYESNGYFADVDQKMSWQPGGGVSIDCFLFRKAV